MIKKINLSKLKPNPNNPRFIKDDKFDKLLNSIKEFPEMMDKRPIVCVTDTDNLIYPLGGNMRLKALQELEYKEIPETWITLADEWTEEKRREFVIKDNVGYGEWDWDMLANEWDVEQLEDWGLDVKIKFDDEEDEPEEEKTYVPTYRFEVSCKTESEKNKLMADLLQKGYSCTDDY